MLPHDGIEITWLPLSAVAPYEANPKNPNNEFFEYLMQSIQQFGLVLPLHVIPHKSNDADYLLIDGHQRFYICSLLGFEMAPFVIHDHITIDDVPDFIETISNTTAAWNKQKLAALLERLQNRVDLDVTGFTQEEVDRLVQKAAAKKPHTPLKPKPVKRKRRVSVMLTSKDYDLVSTVLAEIMAEGYGEPDALVRMMKAAAVERKQS